MGQVPGGAMFIHSKGYTVLQHNSQDLEELRAAMHGHIHGDESKAKGISKSIRSHAYNVEFLNANPAPIVIADKALPGFSNYFIGNDPSKWATECRTFQGITVQNLYPSIDLRYYTDDGLLKYDLIVKPGADLSKVAMRYNGVEKLEIRNKILNVKTSVGDLQELEPFTYQSTEKGRKQVTNKYVIKNNIVRFDVKDYDKRSNLIIDPTWIFTSFAGGNPAANWGFTATYGPDGSMFGGGIVQGQGFPVSTGAIQSIFAGGDWDIGVIKLSADGSTRMYATYIGGRGIEQPHSLVVDQQGNLVIAGRTNSAEYPTTGAVGTIGPGGGYDIVVTKLNATGTALIGSKKIGGTLNDGVNISTSRARSSLQYNYGDDGRSEVIVDAAGNIYLASSTQSGSSDPAVGFPIVGGFQSTFGGGQQDGVLLKFPPDVSALTFSSFLGGSDNDAAYVLSLHPANGNIYVAGGTESGNFPGVNGTSLYSSKQGGIDGFVSIVSNNGSSLIRSTFMGTSGMDQVFGIQFDRLGFPYVMGQTTGVWPIRNAAWSQTNGKQFIAKLEPNLSNFVYSTVFGSGGVMPDISPVAFLVDRCENVYVSGWGGPIEQGGFNLAGTSGLTATSDALIAPPRTSPSQTDGKDFYFFVLKKNASEQLYGSFYGQFQGYTDHVDGGTSRFDANGVIYQAICANCGGGSFPVTPGAWATSHQSAQCNLAMVKIEFDLAGVRSAIQSIINGVPRDTAGCVPLTVNFRDTALNAVRYEWDFGDGSPMVTTTLPDTSHEYTAVGTYRVMLVAIDPNSCNLRDTSYLNIRVGDIQALPDFSFSKLEPCDSFRFRFDNQSIAPPTVPFQPNSFTWDFGDGSPLVVAGTNSVTHSYRSAGTYNVRLFLNDENYCNAPDSIVKQVRVAANVKAGFTLPPDGCEPFTTTFENTSEAGSRFIWTFGDGTTSTEVSPTHTFSAGTYTIKLVAIDSATCNLIDSTSATLNVFAKPTAAFDIASPQPPPVNTAITFTNSSSADAVRFKWLFGDGDSLVTISRGPIEHEFNATNTFEVLLIAYNSNGCSDTARRLVTAIVEPAVDVPNAFTPLSGDINSVVIVRGYAIGKMKFIIWNRWGQKVFETENSKQGWDGRYKGAVQPMDVYVYTLEVEFTDGTKAVKKGDITLIR
ncbi:MAG: PKD domain-containing protein [Chitinophagaceae bacterium]